jgi:hypothetical protein
MRSRPESYRRAKEGAIPTVADGIYLWVPRAKWDRQVKCLLREPHKSR